MNTMNNNSQNQRSTRRPPKARNHALRVRPKKAIRLHFTLPTLPDERGYRRYLLSMAIIFMVTTLSFCFNAHPQSRRRLPIYTDTFDLILKKETTARVKTGILVHYQTDAKEQITGFQLQDHPFIPEAEVQFSLPVTRKSEYISVMKFGTDDDITTRYIYLEGKHGAYALARYFFGELDRCQYKYDDEANSILDMIEHPESLLDGSGGKCISTFTVDKSPWINQLGPQGAPMGTVPLHVTPVQQAEHRWVLSMFLNPGM